jgi:kynureninase
MPELSKWREEFPVVNDRTYLISASLGPLSRRSRALAEQHLDLWQGLGPEELWFDHGMPMLDRCRELFASLVGADVDETAIVPSVSTAMSSIATCLDFNVRPKVVTTDMDFPTNHYVWRAQERRGAKIDVVPSADGIHVDTEDFLSAIDDQTLVVNLNRVLFESSYIQDAKAIIEKAHSVPIDVHELQVDFYVTGALKWLCGGQGLAFLYCRRDLIQDAQPLVVGWFGTKDPFDFDRSGLNLRDDARRFETGTYAMPQAFTAAGGLEIILEVGVDNIRARSQELTRGLIERIDEAGLELLSPREDAKRSGVVRMRIPGGRTEAERVLHELFARDVVLDSRNDALRLSPHFFNDESDLDRCFEELKQVL